MHSGLLARAASSRELELTGAAATIEAMAKVRATKEVENFMTICKRRQSPCEGKNIAGDWPSRVRNVGFIGLEFDILSGQRWKRTKEVS